MASKKARAWLTDIGVLTARPAAFVVFALYGVAWIAFGNGLEWHSLATLATWGMTLVIQRAEHRDTQAIHAKLDELSESQRRGKQQNHRASMAKYECITLLAADVSPSAHPL